MAAIRNSLKKIHLDTKANLFPSTKYRDVILKEEISQTNGYGTKHETHLTNGCIMDTDYSPKKPSQKALTQKLFIMPSIKHVEETLKWFVSSAVKNGYFKSTLFDQLKNARFFFHRNTKHTIYSVDKRTDCSFYNSVLCGLSATKRTTLEPLHLIKSYFLKCNRHRQKLMKKDSYLLYIKKAIISITASKNRAYKLNNKKYSLMKRNNPVRRTFVNIDNVNRLLTSPILKKNILCDIIKTHIKICQKRYYHEYLKKRLLVLPIKRKKENNYSKINTKCAMKIKDITKTKDGVAKSSIKSNNEKTLISKSNPSLCNLDALKAFDSKINTDRATQIKNTAKTGSSTDNCDTQSINKESMLSENSSSPFNLNVSKVKFDSKINVDCPTETKETTKKENSTAKCDTKSINKESLSENSSSPFNLNVSKEKFDSKINVDCPTKTTKETTKRESCTANSGTQSKETRSISENSSSFCYLDDVMKITLDKCTTHQSETLLNILNNEYRTPEKTQSGNLRSTIVNNLHKKQNSNTKLLNSSTSACNTTCISNSFMNIKEYSTANLKDSVFRLNRNKSDSMLLAYNMTRPSESVNIGNETENQHETYNSNKRDSDSGHQTVKGLMLNDYFNMGIEQYATKDAEYTKTIKTLFKPIDGDLSDANTKVDNLMTKFKKTKIQLARELSPNIKNIKDEQLPMVVDEADDKSMVKTPVVEANKTVDYLVPLKDANNKFMEFIHSMGVQKNNRYEDFNKETKNVLKKENSMISNSFKEYTPFNEMMSEKIVALNSLIIPNMDFIFSVDLNKRLLDNFINKQIGVKVDKSDRNSFDIVKAKILEKNYRKVLKKEKPNRNELVTIQNKNVKFKTDLEVVIEKLRAFHNASKSVQNKDNMVKALSAKLKDRTSIIKKNDLQFLNKYTVNVKNEFDRPANDDKPKYLGWSNVNRIMPNSIDAVNEHETNSKAEKLKTAIVNKLHITTKVKNIGNKQSQKESFGNIISKINIDENQRIRRFIPPEANDSLFSKYYNSRETSKTNLPNYQTSVKNKVSSTTEYLTGINSLQGSKIENKINKRNNNPISKDIKPVKDTIKLDISSKNTISNNKINYHQTNFRSLQWIKEKSVAGSPKKTHNSNNPNSISKRKSADDLSISLNKNVPKNNELNNGLIYKNNLFINKHNMYNKLEKESKLESAGKKVDRESFSDIFQRNSEQIKLQTNTESSTKQNRTSGSIGNNIMNRFQEVSKGKTNIDSSTTQNQTPGSIENNVMNRFQEVSKEQKNIDSSTTQKQTPGSIGNNVINSFKEVSKEQTNIDSSITQNRTPDFIGNNVINSFKEVSKEQTNIDSSTKQNRTPDFIENNVINRFKEVSKEQTNIDSSTKQNQTPDFIGNNVINRFKEVSKEQTNINSSTKQNQTTDFIGNNVINRFQDVSKGQTNIDSSIKQNRTTDFIGKNVINTFQEVSKGQTNIDSSTKQNQTPDLIGNNVINRFQEVTKGQTSIDSSTKQNRTPDFIGNNVINRFQEVSKGQTNIDLSIKQNRTTDFIGKNVINTFQEVSKGQTNIDSSTKQNRIPDFIGNNVINKFQKVSKEQTNINLTTKQNRTPDFIGKNVSNRFQEVLKEQTNIDLSTKQNRTPDFTGNNVINRFQEVSKEQTNIDSSTKVNPTSGYIGNNVINRFQEVSKDIFSINKPSKDLMNIRFKSAPNKIDPDVSKVQIASKETFSTNISAPSAKISNIDFKSNPNEVASDFESEPNWQKVEALKIHIKNHRNKQKATEYDMSKMEKNKKHYDFSIKMQPNPNFKESAEKIQMSKKLNNVKDEFGVRNDEDIRKQKKLFENFHNKFVNTNKRTYELNKRVKSVVQNKLDSKGHQSERNFTQENTTSPQLNTFSVSEPNIKKNERHNEEITEANITDKEMLVKNFQPTLNESTVVKTNTVERSNSDSSLPLNNRNENSVSDVKSEQSLVRDSNILIEKAKLKPEMNLRSIISELKDRAFRFFNIKYKAGNKTSGTVDKKFITVNYAGELIPEFNNNKKTVLTEDPSRSSIRVANLSKINSAESSVITKVNSTEILFTEVKPITISSSNLEINNLNDSHEKTNNLDYVKTNSFDNNDFTSRKKSNVGLLNGVRKNNTIGFQITNSYSTDGRTIKESIETNSKLDQWAESLKFQGKNSGVTNKLNFRTDKNNHDNCEIMSYIKRDRVKNNKILKTPLNSNTNVDDKLESIEKGNL